MPVLGDIGPIWVVAGIVLVPTLLATFVAIMGVQMLRQAQASMVRMRDKALIIEQKLDVIHEITNSRLHRIESELQETKTALAVAVEREISRDLRPGPQGGAHGGAV